MKTHVLILAKNFPQSHPRNGEPTNFAQKLKVGKKHHTIRDNYSYWESKISDVQNNKAILSIREWSGKPYNSKQIEITQLTSKDEVTVEKIYIKKNKAVVPYLKSYCEIPLNRLAKNDGLNLSDFKAWFNRIKIPADKPFAIIHFNANRYRNYSQSVADFQLDTITHEEIEKIGVKSYSKLG